MVEMMRSLLILALLGSTAAASTPPGVTLVASPDPAMTVGEVVIDGDPADVFAAACDYRKWTEIMPDVAKVEITEQHGIDARVTLVSPSGHRDNLKFHNQPMARMIYFEDTGNGGRADVWAEIVFAPATEPANTRVHIRLYAKVHGVATLVVHEGTVRDQREQKIAAELVHIRDYFRRRVARSN
jgi:carbon monoxide dehydrogenase subunit G